MDKNIEFQGMRNPYYDPEKEKRFVRNIIGFIYAIILSITLFAILAILLDKPYEPDYDSDGLTLGESGPFSPEYRKDKNTTVQSHVSPEPAVTYYKTISGEERLEKMNRSEMIEEILSHEDIDDLCDDYGYFPEGNEY